MKILFYTFVLAFFCRGSGDEAGANKADFGDAVGTTSDEEDDEFFLAAEANTGLSTIEKLQKDWRNWARSKAHRSTVLIDPRFQAIPPKGAWSPAQSFLAQREGPGPLELPSLDPRAFSLPERPSSATAVITERERASSDEFEDASDVPQVDGMPVFTSALLVGANGTPPAQSRSLSPGAQLRLDHAASSGRMSSWGRRARRSSVFFTKPLRSVTDTPVSPLIRSNSDPSLKSKYPNSIELLDASDQPVGTLRQHDEILRSFGDFHYQSNVSEPLDLGYLPENPYLRDSLCEPCPEVNGKVVVFYLTPEEHDDKWHGAMKFDLDPVTGLFRFARIRSGGGLLGIAIYKSDEFDPEDNKNLKREIMAVRMAYNTEDEQYYKLAPLIILKNTAGNELITRITNKEVVRIRIRLIRTPRMRGQSGPGDLTPRGLFADELDSDGSPATPPRAALQAPPSPLWLGPQAPTPGHPLSGYVRPPLADDRNEQPATPPVHAATPPGTPPAQPPAATVTREVRFPNIDYEGTCGDEATKAEFLAKCSAAVAPARCTDARPGSTIVTIEGSLADVLVAVNAAVAATGGRLAIDECDTSGATLCRLPVPNAPEQQEQPEEDQQEPPAEERPEPREERPEPRAEERPATTEKPPTENGKDQPSEPTNKEAVYKFVLVCGGVVLFALIVVLVLWCRDKRSMNIQATERARSIIEEYKMDRPKMEPTLVQHRDWERVKLIDKGAYGTVYTAVDNVSGILFAVKEVLLIPRHRGEAKVIKRKVKSLRREMEVLTNLKHPNIVRYLGYSLKKELGMKFCIHMELVTGGSLESLILNVGALNGRLAKRYIRHIVDGLAFLHSRNVIHRDLKPGNVLVSRDGICKLADFGTAVDLDEITHSTAQSLCGTPAFIAPEVIRKQNYTAASDIWSLGITIAFTLTGEVPWMVSHAMELMMCISAGTAMLNLPRDIDVDAKLLIQRCCVYDLADRVTIQDVTNDPFLDIPADDPDPIPMPQKIQQHLNEHDRNYIDESFTINSSSLQTILDEIKPRKWTHKTQTLQEP